MLTAGVWGRGQEAGALVTSACVTVPSVGSVVILVVVVVVSIRGAPVSVVAPAVGLLRGEQIDDGRDERTVFGAAVTPVHRLWALDFLLQEEVQLLPQVLKTKNLTSYKSEIKCNSERNLLSALGRSYSRACFTKLLTLGFLGH